MAFHEIERGMFKGNSALTNTVKVRIAKSFHQNAVIVISGDIDKKVGEPMFFNLLIGSGEHSGFIALVPRNSKGSASYKINRVGKCATVTVSARKIGLLPSTFSCEVPYEITADGVVFDIRPARDAQKTPALMAAE